MCERREYQALQLVQQTPLAEALEGRDLEHWSMTLLLDDLPFQVEEWAEEQGRERRQESYWVQDELQESSLLMFPSCLPLHRRITNLLLLLEVEER